MSKKPKRIEIQGVIDSITITQSDGKKMPYLANKRVATAKKKEARNQLVKEGKATELRMSFFTTIMKTLNMSYSEVASRSSFSQQLISWWIHTDDCKLSNIHKIFHAINIKITPFFRPMNVNAPHNVTKYRIETDDISTFMKSDEKGNVIQNCIDRNGGAACRTTVDKRNCHKTTL